MLLLIKDSNLAGSISGTSVIVPLDCQQKSCQPNSDRDINTYIHISTVATLQSWDKISINFGDIRENMIVKFLQLNVLRELPEAILKI